MKTSRFVLRYALLVSAVSLFVLNTACQTSSPPLLVAAAISLRPVLESLQTAYPQGEQLRFSFASSGVIRQQIIEGAPYDVFLSAGTKELTKLAEKGIQGLQTTLAHNPLVIARLQQTEPPCPPAQLKSLLQAQQPPGKLAVGNPKTVPVGYAAQQALGSHWQTLQPQLLFTENAFQNIVYLRNAAVSYAIVYQSDLSAYADIKSCGQFSEQSGVAVTSLALPKEKQHPLQASWLAFLASDTARPLWEKAGFSLP